MWEKKHPYTFKQYKTMITMIDSYEKAIKVIDSCKNETHLEGAIRYCDNFKSQFTRFGSDETLIQIYYTDLIDRVGLKRMNLPFYNLN